MPAGQRLLVTTPMRPLPLDMVAHAYDSIGLGYARHRGPDPRIAAAIRGAIGDAKALINVGAGTGSYEPDDVAVVAVEPSLEMCSQRPTGKAGVIRATAEHLPFPDAAFDAALAVLTLHHWRDRGAGLREMLRVARERVVLFSRHDRMRAQHLGAEQKAKDYATASLAVR